jgi:hypothetical protein
MSADHPLDAPTSQPAETAEELRRTYAAKVLAEVASADALAPGSDAVRSRGNPVSRVLVLKGLAGPAEASGGEAVSGADGDAIDKALTALGWAEGDAFYAMTRPEPGIAEDRRVPRVKALVEALDPVVAIALDAEAAEDLSAAIGHEIASGKPADVAGRRYVAVDGMEASLGNDALKKAVWRQLQAAAPPGPVY